MRIAAEVNEEKRQRFQDTGKLRVLLVGESILSSSFLVTHLWRRGCKCELAMSYEEVLARLGGQDIYLMLCPLRLSRRNLLPLVDLLEGSGISLFYAASADPGCWWLPALRQGRKCFGSHAVSPSEFFSALDEVIERVNPLGGCTNAFPRHES